MYKKRESVFNRETRDRIREFTKYIYEQVYGRNEPISSHQSIESSRKAIIRGTKNLTDLVKFTYLPSFPPNFNKREKKFCTDLTRCAISLGVPAEDISFQDYDSLEPLMDTMRIAFQATLLEIEAYEREESGEGFPTPEMERLD